MGWQSWWVFFPVLVVFVALFAIRSSGGLRRDVGFPYRRGKPLFSAAERSFLGVLDQAVGADYRVFGKVRVADVAVVAPGLGNAARQGALNRIAYKHFDFVVCRAGDLSLVCAVELNDKSHASPRAQARDALVANVCRVIDLPLLAIPAKAVYAVPDLRAQFLAVAEPATSRAQGVVERPPGPFR